MITDNTLVLAGSVSAAGVVTGQAFNGAGSILGANTLDIASLALGGNQPGDFGAGTDLTVMFQVLTAPTTGTNVQFQLIQADDAALSVNVQVINQTDAFAIAVLPAGTLVPLSWDIAAPYPPKRYIGVRIVNTGVIATLAVFAAVVKDPQGMKNIYYKSGFAIL